MTVTPTTEMVAFTNPYVPQRVGRLWVFPDGKTLPVVSGGAVEGDPPPASGAEPPAGPVQLDADHPLVKAHQAKKTELSAAKQRISELESAGKTADEKVADRITKLEAELATERTSALRMRIAAEHKISRDDADLFLTASDEETLTKQAKRFAEQTTERTEGERKRSQVVPGEGKTPKNPSGDGEMREITRSIFNRS